MGLVNKSRVVGGLDHWMVKMALLKNGSEVNNDERGSKLEPSGVNLGIRRGEVFRVRKVPRERSESSVL